MFYPLTVYLYILNILPTVFHTAACIDYNYQSVVHFTKGNNKAIVLTLSLVFSVLLFQVTLKF